MAVTIEHVTFDCADAAELAGFWAQVVDRPVDAESNEFFATVGRAGEALVPVLMFLKVPEERAGKNGCTSIWPAATGPPRWTGSSASAPSGSASSTSTAATG